MSYTQADVDAVDAAIKALSAGVTSVSYNGRTVTYADIEELLKLRKHMQAEVPGSTTRKRYVRVMTSKGL